MLLDFKKSMAGKKHRGYCIDRKAFKPKMKEFAAKAKIC